MGLVLFIQNIHNRHLHLGLNSNYSAPICANLKPMLTYKSEQTIFQLK